MARQTNKDFNKTNDQARRPKRDFKMNFKDDELPAPQKKAPRRDRSTYKHAPIKAPVSTGSKCGVVEFKMPTAMAKAYVDEYKKSHKGQLPSDKHKFLCDIVNAEFGLLGYCVRVIEF